MSQTISKNIFYLTISRIFALVLVGISYAFLFRYLEPVGTGKYQLVLSYVLLFSTIVDFGIQQLITKKISEKPENTKEYFQEFFSFEILLSVFLYILLGIIAYFSHYEKAVFYAILVAGLGMVANALCYPFMAVMAAKQDIKKVSLINFINSLINVSIIFLTIFLHRYIVFLASVQITFGIIDLILYRQFIKKHIEKPEVFKAIFKGDFHLVKNILLQGWPFALLVGFSAIYNRIDVLIIQHFKDFTQLGLYTAAYKIFDLLNFFPAAVSFTLFPFFATLMAKNAILEVRSTLEKYLRLMVLAALPMAIGGMVLADQLILLLAGADFKPSAVILAILIWAPAVQFIYIPINSLIISQLTKNAMVVTGCNVLFNIIGNLILVPTFGIKAAAIMTVFSELVQAGFYFYFVKKNIVSFHFWRFFSKPFFAAIFMGLILWPIRHFGLLITLPIGTVSYLIILIIFGSVNKADFLMFKEMFVRKN